jgi:hypothetical protein
MNERFRTNICMLVMAAHDRIEKLRPLAADVDMEQVLGDRTLKWVRSKKCPDKHAIAFAEAVGFIHGAARALGIMPCELATQLLNKDESEDAEVLGVVAQYAISCGPKIDK